MASLTKLLLIDEQIKKVALYPSKIKATPPPVTPVTP
jgi:hypothetical protein